MDLSFLLPIVRPLLQQLLAYAVTSAAAKTVLIEVLGDLKGCVDSVDNKSAGPLKPLEDDVTGALDVALGGVIAALKA